MAGVKQLGLASTCFKHQQQRYFHEFIKKGFEPKKSLGPNEKSLPTNDLLNNLGYTHQTLNAGVLHYLPLGERVLQKITNIVRTELNKHDDASKALLTTIRPKENGTAELETYKIKECELSSLSSLSLWEKTGRYPSDEIFTLKDEKLLLVPTCEEEITSLMKRYITSYKDLPTILYQISRKYRYEKRPRGGILRGREFYMKDAYSFHATSDDALKCFDFMNSKYGSIFRKFKVPFHQAWADSGSIGGDKSMEFHYVDETIGDDKILICNNKTECGHVSNVEKFFGLPNPSKLKATIDNITIKWCYNVEKTSLACIYYPSDDVLDLKKINHYVTGDKNSEVLDMESFNMKSDDFLKKINETMDDDELLMMPIVRLIDCRIHDRANLPEFELRKYSKFNFVTMDDGDLCEAKEHDICERCEVGEMEVKKSIEVGHIFYLGDKYTTALDVKFTNEKNKQEIVTMGCYGIGISRLIGAIAQLSKDEHGLRWPSTVAPYICNVVFDNKRLLENANSTEIEQEIQTFMDTFEKSPKSENIFFDIREKVSLGSKIKSSHAVGIPICCIVGGKNVDFPFVQLEIRGKRYSERYLNHYDTLKDQYQWTIVPADEATSSFEKHIVHKDHAYELMCLLIKDL